MLPTRGQRRILDALRACMEETGRPPTLQEIARRCGLSSPATVHKHLRLLEERGLLRRRRGRRGVILRPEAVGRPAVDVPLLGTIAAGRPVEAIEDPATLAVPAGLVRGRRHYLLEVRGDSMIDEQILDGDYVVVEDRPVARDGEVVVALLHGRDATLKTIRRGRGTVRLLPANPRLGTLLVKPADLKIQGVATALLRRYP
jgi:repressor LexA